jgi:hypothetical protein
LAVSSSEQGGVRVTLSAAKTYSSGSSRAQASVNRAPKADGSGMRDASSPACNNRAQRWPFLAPTNSTT